MLASLVRGWFGPSVARLAGRSVGCWVAGWMAADVDLRALRLPNKLGLLEGAVGGGFTNNVGTRLIKGYQVQ